MFVVSLVLAVALFGSISVGAIKNSVSENDEDMTEFSLFENDEVEIAALTGPKVLFQDYCLRTRDKVRDYVKKSAVNGTRKVFQIFLNTENSQQIDDVFDKVKVVEEDIKQGAEIVKQSLHNEIGKSLVEKAEATNDVSLWTTLKGAVAIVLKAAMNFAQSETAKRIALLKEKFTADEIKSFVKDVCRQVTYQFREELERDFDNAKSQAYKAAMTQGMPRDQVADVKRETFETVGCVTTRRMTNIAKYCNFLTVAGPVLWPLFDL